MTDTRANMLLPAINEAIAAIELALPHLSLNGEGCVELRAARDQLDAAKDWAGESRPRLGPRAEADLRAALDAGTPWHWSATRYPEDVPAAPDAALMPTTLRKDGAA